MYWDIKKILPYQRIFNFINGPREIGKTYSSLIWFIKQAITKNKQFIYVCRTQDEKKHGVLKRATEKVCKNEFPDLQITGDNQTLFLNKIPIAQCVALSEYKKIKKFSFPNAYYILMDEYMIEDRYGGYVNGWNEPDLFLSLYQTIDRGEDRVKCFLLGNNTSFYNPYHLHPAFNIPFINPGEIWKSKTTLFQWAVPSQELTAHLNNLSFTKAVKNTNYGKYAIQGQYVNDNPAFIQPLTNKSKPLFSVFFNGVYYGIFQNLDYSFTVSKKFDKNVIVFTLSPNDMKENMILVKGKSIYLERFVTFFKQSRVYFDSMTTKSKAIEWIRAIL